MVVKDYDILEKTEKRLAFDRRYKKFAACPVTTSIQVIGGKWKPTILYFIYHDINRFGQMLKLLNGISKKMLTDQLRELEADGIITRTIFAEIPPRVEYALTPLGLSLSPVLNALCSWGEFYLEHTHRSQETLPKNQVLVEEGLYGFVP
jgi:DNA-binding HxlR family transcriptional regulator